MTVLYAKNPDLGGEARSVLDAAPAAGATSITVENNEGFANNDYLIIGNAGTDLAEVQRVNAGVSGNTALTVTATKFAHVIDEPVQKVRYNQARFYRAPSETGAAVLLATINLDFTAADQYTAFNDEQSISSDWFQTSWYNSQTSTETARTRLKQADPMYCSVKDVEAFMNSTYGTNSDVPFNTVVSAIINNTLTAESVLGRPFRSVPIPTSYYEYHDGKKDSDTNYFLKHTPVISVDTLQTTASDEDTTATNVTWNTLVKDDDFFLDKETGRIGIVNTVRTPSEGRNRVRAAYTYGTNSVPADIKRLCVLLVAKDLFLGGFAKATSEGRSLANTNLEWLTREIDKIISAYVVESRGNT